MSLLSGTALSHAVALSTYLSTTPPPPTTLPLPPTLLHTGYLAGAVVTAALSPASPLSPSAALLLAGALLARAHPGPSLAGLRARVGAAASASGVCGTVWRRDELAYKCKDCERDPTCAICVACFRAGDHEGHEYAMIRTAGGCCDCGDVQAWKSAGFCERHRGASAEEEDPAEGMEKALREAVGQVAAAVAECVRREARTLRGLLKAERAATAAGRRRRLRAEGVRIARRAGAARARGEDGDGEGAEGQGEAEEGGGGDGGAGGDGDGNDGDGDTAGNEDGNNNADGGMQQQQQPQVTGQRWGTGTGNGAGSDGAAQERAGGGQDAAAVQSARETSATDKRRLDIRQRISRVCACLKWLGELVECGDGVRRVVAVQLSKEPCPDICRVAKPADVAGDIAEDEDEDGDITDPRCKPDAVASVIWLEDMLSLDGCDQLPLRVQRSLHSLYYQLITDLVFKRCFLELFSSNYERFVNILVRKKSLPRTHPEYSPPDEDESARQSDEYGRTESEPRSDVLDSFSVQLFTVPALIPVMMRDGGVLDVLLRVILNIFEVASAPVDVYSDRRKKAQAEAEALAQAQAEEQKEGSGDASASSEPDAAMAGVDSPVEGVATAAEGGVARAPRGGPRATTRSMLPMDVVADLGILGPFHPINGLTLEAAFDENAPGEADHAVAANGGGLSGGGQDTAGHGAANGAGADLGDINGERNRNPAGAADEVEELAPAQEMAAGGPVADDGDGDDRMSTSSAGDGVDAGVEGVNAEGGRGDAEDAGDGIAGDHNDGNGRDDVAMNVDGAGAGNRDWDEEEVDAEGPLPAGLPVLDASDDDDDDDDDSDSDVANVIVDENGEEVIDLDAFLNDGTLIPDEIPTFGAGDIHLPLRADGRLRVDGFVRERMAKSREDVRKRFLAIISARRKTAATMSGEGDILHPMRVDWSRKQRIFDYVGWRVIRDLRYVLTHVEVAVHLIHSRPDLMRLFLRVMSMLQGMNPTPRRFGDHVRNDSELWGKAFTLEIEFFHLIELLVVAFCHDPPKESSPEVTTYISPSESRLRATRLVRGCLDEWLDREEGLEAGSLPDDEVFTVATAVSMHVPLHRLLAVFGHNLIRLDKVDLVTSLTGDPTRSLVGKEGEGPDLASSSGADAAIARNVRDAERVLKHLLRIQVFLGQAQAGMWRRNGRAAVGHLMLYRNVVCAEWSVDLDLFLMQQACVVMGAEDFQNRAGEEFGLGDMVANFMHLNLPVGKAAGTWLGDDPDLPPSAVASQVDEYEPALLESMVTLLVHVATDRARCGYSDKQYLRRKFLHLLCVSDQTHSQLLRACPHWISQSQAPHDNFALSSASIPAENDASDDGADEAISTSTAVEEALAAIADFSRPRDMEQGRFRLKDELWEEFDHFLPHLTLRERAAAEQRYSSLRSRQQLPPQVIPALSAVVRPTFAPFTPLVTNLHEMASHKDTFIAVVFRRFLQPSGLRALEGVLPPTLQIAVVAIEAAPKTFPDGNSSGASWLNDLASDEAFGGSVLDSVVKMYERSRNDSSDSSALFSESRLALVRILKEAYVRGNLDLKKRLHSACPHLISSPVDNAASTTETARACSGTVTGDASGSGGSGEVEAPVDSRRERMLKMKKAKQAAALEQMRAAQSKFASTIGEDEETPGSGAVVAGAVGDAGQDVASTLNTAARGTSPEIEASTKPSCAAPASLVRDHVCALCRESESAPEVMGLVGFAQKTRVPFLADQTRGGRSRNREGNHSFVTSRLGDADNFTRGTSGEPGPGIAQDSVGGASRSYANRGLAGIAELSAGDKEASWVYDKSIGLSRALLAGGIEAGPNLHIGFCGHAIHISCYERYFASLKTREQNSDMYEGHHLLTLSSGEFLCPVCRRMGNFMLPLTAVDAKEMMPSTSGGQSDSDMATWAHRAFRRLALSNQASLPSPSQDSDREAALSRGGNAAGADLMAPWVSEPPRSSPAPWGNAMSVMRQLNAKAGEAVSRAGRRANAASSPGHYQLCCATGATIVCAEIAARSGAWEESKARRVLGTLIRQTRVLVKEVPCYQSHTPVTHELWKCLMSGGETAIDAFAAVLFMLFQWPARLTEQDVRHLVCAGYVATVDLARRSGGDQVLGSLLYLRRASVLIGCIYDREINLRPYPTDVTALSKQDLGAEHITLTSFLGLPRPEGVSVAWLVEDSPPSTADSKAFPRNSTVNFIPRRLSLLTLPTVFQELLEKLDGRQCHACEDAPRKPALCLTCGRVCCSVASPPASAPQGSKTCPGWTRQHALSCGAGVGMFLVLKTTNVHVYRKDRLAKWGSPYLDEHGEEDPELRRGKPLLLSEDRYAALQKLWLSHGFDHDFRVLSQTFLNRQWAGNGVFLAAAPVT